MGAISDVWGGITDALGGVARAGNDIVSGAQDVGSAAIDFATGRKGAQAAKDAAQIQADASQKGLDLQKDIYTQNKDILNPYVKGGTNTFNTLNDNNRNGMYEQNGFAPSAQENFQFGNFNDGYQAPAAFNAADIGKDPGYQFRLQQGADLFERRAAGQGMSANDGNFATGLLKYGQGLASEEVKNSFDRYKDQRDFGYGAHLDNQNIFDSNRKFGADQFTGDRNFGYNRSQDIYNSQVGAKTANFNNNFSLANMGLTAGSALAGVGSGYANNAAEGYQGIGNSLAAGKIGAANARAGGTQNLVNLGGAIAGSYFGRK